MWKLKHFTNIAFYGKNNNNNNNEIRNTQLDEWRENIFHIFSLFFFLPNFPLFNPNKSP